MCIVNRMTRQKFTEYKKTLPDEFTVYRLMVVMFDGDLVGIFCGDKRDVTGQPGLHEARNLLLDKIPITYKPGFHVYKTKKGAEQYTQFATKTWRCNIQIVKAKAKRTWVTKAGNAAKFGTEELLSNHRVLVLSHILMENKP